MKTNSDEDKAKIASLEESIETMKQMLDLTKAKNNSLEIESHNKDVKIEKIQLAVKMQDTAIRKMQEDAKKKVNPATENTIKALREETKAKKKEADEANKRANEAIKKLKNETNEKAAAQSEVVRLSKMVDNLSALLDMKKKNEEDRRRSKSSSSFARLGNGRLVSRHDDL